MNTCLIPTLSCMLSASVAIADSARVSPVDQALRHVPTDAALALIVPDFDAVISGLNAFGNGAGLDSLAELKGIEILDGPLDGNVVGIDLDGPLVVAMLPVPRDPVLIVSLKEAEVWKQAVGAEPAGAEMVDTMLWKFQMHGEPWFAALVDNFAILAEDAEVVKNAAAGIDVFGPRLAVHGDTWLTDHQLIFWADVEQWQTLIQPAVGIAEGLFQMSIAMSDPEAEGNIAIWKWLFAQFRTILQETQTYIAGVRCDANGVFAQDAISVLPDGKVAEYLGQIRPATKDILRGLPVKPGLLTFGTEWEVPDHLVSFSEAMLDAMFETEQGKAFLADAETSPGIEAAKRLYKLLTGYNGTLFMADDGGLAIAGLYLTDQPQVTMSELRQSVDSMATAKMMNMFSSGLVLTMEHSTERAFDRDIDVYTMVMETDNEEIGRAIRMIYGERPEFRVFEHRDGVGYTVGSGDANKQALAWMLEPDARELPDHRRVVEARGMITPDPQLSLFLDINELARFGVRAWTELEQKQEQPLKLVPRDDPLVVFGIYLAPDSMRSEFYLPAASLRHVVDAIEELERKKSHHATANVK